MAVDLTPRFRRMNSQSCFRVNKPPPGFSGPFQATQLWQSIIKALQTQVDLRPRRQHLRLHLDCFTGSDAVDVVLSHLMQNIFFCTSEVSRLKATRLCQALMESRVFEPVGMKLFRREREMVFEDSSCSLYQFLEGSSKKGDDTAENHNRRVERLLKNINLNPSIPSDLNRAAISNGFLSKKVVLDVWRQQTLLQLLQVVEIPMLDGILTSPAKPKPLLPSLHNHTDLVISNTCVDREISESLNLPEMDSWLVAAVDCLELFPDQLIVVASEQLMQLKAAEYGDKFGEHKKLLFDCIAKYYNSPERPPLLPERYIDIHTGILQLLDNSRTAEALTAAQLCLQLLESTSRDELCRLLGFMAAIAHDQAFRLQKQIGNRALVCKTFGKAVIQSKDLTRVQCEKLLLFLVDNHMQLFKTPSSLLDAVRNTLQTLQQGRDLDNVAVFRFCQQVSLQQYEMNKDKATAEGLKQLMLHIAHTDRLSNRDKKRMAKLFQKHHPGSMFKLLGSDIMESMLNKLKSTVTKVTADVTSAVMGNPVTREFEVGRHIASGGPGMSWRIYNGTKKSTKQEVAVFVFDKKVVDCYQKFDKDQIIDSLKKGVQQLTRLRHPRLLTVQHPLEESRDCLAFCTEPVFASLANVLGNWDNLPSPVPSEIKEYKLYDVEAKYGLLQSGAWKIMGFDFSITSSNPSDTEPKYVCKEWEPNLPPLCLPNPEYVAPEYILSVSCDAASDMYSLGVLIHAVFNEGKAVFQVNKQDIFKSFSRQLDQLSHLSPGVLTQIPEEVREHVKMLLSVTSTVRPDADQMTKIPFFDDVGAMTLQYFDSLFQRDNLQKSQFFKGLPKRVVVYRILPALTSEFVNPDMVPFVLPNVLLIAEDCTKEEYIRLVLPDLTPVFKMQEPVQILLIFLQKMDLLLTKTPPEDIKNSVLPMVYRAVEAPSVQIQVRVNSLVCLGKILEYLDKWFVIDEILPFLQQIPSREPAVLMGVLGIYKCTFTHKKLGIPKEHLAAKSLPHLVSLSIDNNLNLNQFNSFMAVIKDMLSRMEAEHKTKLEQLHVMQEQHRSLNITNQMNQSEDTRSTPSPAPQVRDIDEIFSGASGVIDKEHKSSSTISQPSRVSLTLEEKQRLAKEQEQAAKLRSQQPLAPQSIKPATTTPQAKDLTSSLLNNMTSLNNMSLNSGSRTMPMQGGAMASTFLSGPTIGGMGTMGVSNGFNTTVGFQTGGMGMRPVTPALYGGMATTTSTPNFGSITQNQNQAGRPPDMSALDSLFSSNKPKVSLNQMAPKPALGGTTPSPWLSQFDKGQPSQNVPIQATPMGIAGAQGGFGMQANPFFNPQNFTQSPAVNTGTMKQSASFNNDLKDLFG
ncbi:hypothetical protein DNTS_018489 [Danionella cerebrum]|uniref:Protein kinase domain-containing protein n=1 Tax=Danionella cerebrum TaxID=2873325 RepID=A0A553MZ08_9TELE|nr:hypothetical protein DNTS_018489 [Danionella translucida]TRY58407.1 hypothetical protein DNTS_018489 [Danionella translucida]TRY58408.1 hypothetical protein DNTS_018489 [Danionella translucida]